MTSVIKQYPVFLVIVILPRCIVMNKYLLIGLKPSNGGASKRSFLGGASPPSFPSPLTPEEDEKPTVPESEEKEGKQT